MCFIMWSVYLTFITTANSVFFIQKLMNNQFLARSPPGLCPRALKTPHRLCPQQKDILATPMDMTCFLIKWPSIAISTNVWSNGAIRKERLQYYVIKAITNVTRLTIIKTLWFGLKRRKNWSAYLHSYSVHLIWFLTK